MQKCAPTLMIVHLKESNSDSFHDTISIKNTLGVIFYVHNLPISNFSHIILFVCFFIVLQ